MDFRGHQLLSPERIRLAIFIGPEAAAARTQSFFLSLQHSRASLCSVSFTVDGATESECPG